MDTSKPLWSYEARATYAGERAGRGSELHIGAVHAEIEAEALEEAREDAWNYPFRHIYCGEGEDSYFEQEVEVAVRQINQPSP